MNKLIESCDLTEEEFYQESDMVDNLHSEQSLFNCVGVLWNGTEEYLEAIGSGVFYYSQYYGFCFLTANHVISALDQKKTTIVSNGKNVSEGLVQRKIIRDDDLDFAIILFDSDFAIKHHKELYFLPDHIVSEKITEDDDDFFTICGLPNTKNKLTKHHNKKKIYLITTDKVDSGIFDQLDNRYSFSHIALNRSSPNKFLNDEGEKVQLPELEGISGGLIVNTKKTLPNTVDNEVVFKGTEVFFIPVGIAIEYYRDPSVIIGVRFQIINQVLEQWDKDGIR